MMRTCHSAWERKMCIRDRVKTLTRPDLVAVVNYLLGLIQGIGSVDDIDPVSYTHLSGCPKT